MPEQPLAGIMVLDLTRHMAGPYATMMMGDFGADVIKVESVPHGDPSRRLGTNFIDGQSTMFLTWNRSKRSIAIDLRRAEGMDIVRALAKRADILIENYKPGVMDAMGIGWQTLHELNPRLIYVSVNAYGSTGPWRDRPGTDPAIQAISGVMSVTGERGGSPLLAGIPVADYSGSLLAMQAMLLGLVARQATGEGQHIETSLLGGLLFGLTTRVGPYFHTGQDPTRWGSQHSQVVPYQAFATADGYVVAGVWEEKGWAPFCRALGVPELADDPRFQSNVDRVARRDEVTAILAAEFAKRTTMEWDKCFADANALFAPVNTFSQILESEQVAANNHVIEVETAGGSKMRQIGPVLKCSSTPAKVQGGPPMLGQHTVEILRESGLDDELINSLVKSGVVRVFQPK
jgi:crotonobetainyl-CoA:carnitine CoA-transferase CaiB-like acyl-CoA transferase